MIQRDYYTFGAYNIGTSKVVATLMDTEGKSVTKEVFINCKTPSEWLNGLIEASSIYLENTRPDFLSICGTAGTFLFIDEFGNPVGEAKLYNENNDDALAYLNKKYELTSLAPAVTNPLSNLYSGWNTLDENDKKRVKYILPQSVWLLHRLTKRAGEEWSNIVSDTNNLSHLGFDENSNSWPEEICDFLEIPNRILPGVASTGDFLDFAQGELAVSCGVNGSKVFQGMIDGNAEAIYLIGDILGRSGIIAGSTSTIKVVSDKSLIEEQDIYYRKHPFSHALSLATSWITTGENIRQRSSHSLLSSQEIISKSWHMDEKRIFPIKPSKVPVSKLYTKFEDISFVRSVIESSVWWEASRLQKIFNGQNINPEQVHMMGGTTKSRRWMTLRASAYGREILVHSPIGAIGAIVPGLLKEGVFKSFDDFSQSCLKQPHSRYLPKPLTAKEKTRQNDWEAQFA